jgi:GT2 family glycosyltransferase
MARAIDRSSRRPAGARPIAASQVNSAPRRVAEPEGSSSAASTAGISVVVPTYNALHFLKRTIPALEKAVHVHGRAELLVVDNGSTDGSPAWLAERSVRVIQSPEVTISTLRNLGARATQRATLAFVDADCLVEPDYLVRVEETLATSGADVCGSRYELPEDPVWVEALWQELHDANDQERAVSYLPGGNLIVRRGAFERIDGFDESLVTGEDADFGLRLRESGFSILNTPSVRVRHLGNPKTIGAFYRKQRWHALGMFGTVRMTHIDRPVAMMFAHLLSLLAAVWLLIQWPAIGVVSLLVLPWWIPALTVVYRLRKGGTARLGFLRAVFLYQVYYLARIAALIRVVTGRGKR